MYLMGIPIWILLFAISIKSFSKTLSVTQNNFKYVLPILFLLPLIQFIYNWKNHNLASHSLSSAYARNILENMPENSVLTCFSDISCFSLIYAQSIEKIRTDLAIVPVTPKMQSAVITNHSDIFRYSYSQNPHRISSIIARVLNSDKRVFAAEIPPEYIEFMGLDGKAFYLSPRDTVFEISKMPLGNDKHWKNLSLDNFNLTISQPFTKAFKLMLFEQYAKNATLLARLNYKLEAGENYTKALKLKPHDITVTNMLKELPAYDGDPDYLAVNRPKAVADVLALSQNCQSDLMCQIHHFQLASFIEPDNIQIRQILIDLYSRSDITDLAAEESKLVDALSKGN